MRITPAQYFSEIPEGQVAIPSWVPILLGIALVGCFAVALYAISKVGK